MAKDLVAENIKLKTEIAELRKQVDYLQRYRDNRESRDEEFKNRFKELLITVLGQ